VIGLVLRRIAWSILVVWFVVTATFAIAVAIPADPAKVRLGPHATEETIRRARAYYHLDDGLLAQYGSWLGHVARGELGESNRTNRPVTAILAERVWPTAQLALAAILLQLVIGVPLGVLAAARRNRWPDRAADLIGLIGQSAPAFVVGTVLMYVVAYRWDLLPIGGYGDGLVDRLRHLVLPALTIAAMGVAFYARVVRAELGEVLAEDYIRTARAKGLSEPRVVWRHGLRSALGPLVTLVGLDLGVMLGGAVMTEQIFQWPGLGREVLQAILEIDLPLILGVVLVSAIAIAIANLAVDLVQLWLDPRLRG
jgi:peptide/nickel transport system permease protein